MRPFSPQLLYWALRLWRTRPTQALLSVFGIVAGVAGLVVVIAVGEGAEREMAQALGALGTGTVIVQAGGGAGIPWQRAGRIETLLGDLVQDQAAAAYRQGNVTAGERRVEGVRQVGVDAGYARLYQLRLAAGRFIAPYDLRNREPVCVLGWKLARELFPRRQVVGQSVHYGGGWCTVVGLLADNRYSFPELEGVGVSEADRLLYLPLTTLLRGGEGSSVDELTVRFVDGPHLTAGLASLRRIVTVGTGPSPPQVIVPVELLRQKHRLQQLFQYLLLGAAFALLVVGGTGIMNSMLLNVLSRRPEIGLRRALGATRTDIIAQFVSESTVIALVGGIAGICAGLFAALLLDWFTAWSAPFNAGGALAGCLVSVLIGVVFGSYPALQAASVSPVQALHDM